MTWSTHAVPALFTRPPATPPKSLHRLVDGHKKAPGKSTLPGVATGCCLKLVGSSVRAADFCRGMGVVARMGPLHWM